MFHIKIILIPIILLTTLSSYSQNNFNYLGVLIFNQNSISFKLNLEEHNGIVTGSSITNIGTKDETKSKIKGVYFKSDKSIQLQETQILYTNSEASLNTFCYIKMNLSFKGSFIKKRLEGTFTGHFLDDTECANGKIILFEENKLKKIKQKIQKQNKKEKKDNIDLLVEKTKILKSKDNLTLNSESEKISLFIWDPNQEDNDKIEVNINNETILYNFETKKKKKKLKFNLKKGENHIEIKAISLGKSPPNTTQIELIDEKKKYPIIAHLKLGESVIIKIIK